MTRQIHILVVDDETEHAAAMAESLERVGYVVTTATDGRGVAARVPRPPTAEAIRERA